MASTPRALLVGFVVACLVGPATAAEPLVERLADGLGESTVLAARALSSGQGVCLLDGAAAPLRWFDKQRKEMQADLEQALPGQSVAACGLSDMSLAVVTTDAAVPKLAVLRATVDGSYEVAQVVELPALGEGETWSLAANDQRLFLAAGRQVYRARHATGGVGEPKPYATLPAAARSLAVSRKGYLTALVTGDDGTQIVFLAPNAGSSAELARFDLQTQGLNCLAYGAAKKLPEWPLYAGGDGGLYRIDSKPGPDGLPVAAATLLHATEQPVRALVGVESSEPAEGLLGEDDHGALLALTGDQLLLITPQPTE